MAIYYFDGTQKSPKDYVGIRVNVMVAGKVKQQWFNFKSKITTLEGRAKAKEEAIALHEQWTMEKNLRKEPPKRKNDAFPLFDTGVTGIKMKFRKSNTKNAKTGSENFTAVFDVAGGPKEKRFHKQFGIKNLGYDEAWMLACHYLSERRAVNFSKIYTKKPPIEKTIMLLDWQRKRGENIATKELPNELLERFKNNQDEETQLLYQNVQTKEEKKQGIEAYAFLPQDDNAQNSNLPTL